MNKDKKLLSAEKNTCHPARVIIVKIDRGLNITGHLARVKKLPRKVHPEFEIVRAPAPLPLGAAACFGCSARVA